MTVDCTFTLNVCQRPLSRVPAPLIVPGVGSTTLSVKVEDVPEVKFASPLYIAVIACDPAASVDVVNVAWSSATATIPSVVLPSRNVTMPEAAPIVGEVLVEMVTVNVTGWPTATGLAEDVSDPRTSSP